MNDIGTREVKRTPLFNQHVEAGGKLVEFSGWHLPVRYRGVVQEHRAVRERVGLFDVSHMGEFRVSGSGAERFIQSLTPNDVAALKIGRIHYSGLLTERGTYLDDLLVYRLGQEEFMLVVNASNIEKNYEWLKSHLVQNVELKNVSDTFALLALQGPRAADVLAALTSCDLAEISYYGFKHGDVASVPALISRTGYTGEDGFELYLAPEVAPRVWNELLGSGSSQDILPAGLGARDTLRLEAGMALYGHELDETTTPLEAGLGWVVKLDSGEFLGRDALVEQKRLSPPRRLVGFELTARGIARQGCSVLVGDKTVGKVTSGTWSPTFEKAIGMAFVATDHAVAGTEILVDVRGKTIPGRVVGLPIYRRKK
jgi:aminomethyltransferase